MKTQPTRSSTVPSAPRDPVQLNLRTAPMSAISEDLEDQAQAYWEGFYGKQRLQSPPSQFAAFVATEFKHHPLFVDIGCGNGRDSLFFSYLGHDVIGIDKSASAVDFCNSQMISSGDKLSAFVNCDIGELELNHPLFHAAKDRKKLIYSRFFLHAIQEYKEDELFEFIVQLCQNSEDIVALEFRTQEDEHNPKEAKAHFRRYIAPRDLQIKLENKFMFKVHYQVQGYGLAKFGSEDAHVCRMILSRNN